MTRDAAIGAGSTELPVGPSFSAGLRRDMEVLRELASEESLRRSGLGVVRIAERLGREKSQVSRALRALEAEGLVERDPRNRTYQLGWGLYQLAARGVETRLVRAASVHLQRLAEQFAGAARVCVLIGGQVLPLLAATPGTTARTAVPPEASAAPLLSTPAGPALVPDWSEAALRDLLAKQADPSGGAGSAGDGLLSRHLGQLRGEGFIRFDAQPGDGPGATPRLAAPVRDFRGIVLGAIELTCGPDRDDWTVAGPAVRDSAAAVSAELGYDGR